jgi:uncharacterized membrane protein YbaN (DUF454 family)
MTIFKIFLIIIGTLSLSLGIIGIFVPGLPTTVFLLISAGLYGRSSDRLYGKLLGNKYLGPYILDYQERKGMTLRSKIYAISTMWIMITISSVFLINADMVRIIVICAGFVGTIVIGFFVKTSNNPL